MSYLMWPKLYTMRHLLTMSALLISSLAMGQNNPFWNPDANGDDLIGFTDLASLLSVYNSSIGIDSSVTCEFIGTDLEELVLGALTGEVVIDSMYFESTLSGTAADYTLGCPDPVQTPWSVSQSTTTLDVETNIDENYRNTSAYVDFSNEFYAYFLVEAFRYEGGPWNFQTIIYSNYSDGPFYSSVYIEDFVSGTNVPVQSTYAVFDSLGIREATVDPNNYVRIVPYWHYAE